MRQYNVMDLFAGVGGLYCVYLSVVFVFRYLWSITY